MSSEGIHIHMNSLLNICHPREVKNPATLIGETRTGRKGKKYLSFWNGAKNATPRPPLVNASSRGCREVARKKYMNNFFCNPALAFL